MQETDKEKLKAFQKKMHEEGAAGFADGPCPWDAWDESGAQAGRRVVWEGRARHVGKRKPARRSSGDRILSGLAMIALATMVVGIAGVYFSAEQPQRVAWTAVQPTPIPLPWHDEAGGDRRPAAGMPRPAPRIVEIDALPPTAAGPAIQAVEAPAREDMPSPATAGNPDLPPGADADTAAAQSAAAATAAGGGDDSAQAIEIVAAPTAVLLTDDSGSGEEIDPQLAMEIATAPAVDTEPAGFAAAGWENPDGNPFLASAAGIAVGDTPLEPSAAGPGGAGDAGMPAPAAGDRTLRMAAGRPVNASSGMIIRDVEPQPEAVPPAGGETTAPVEPEEAVPEATPQSTASEPPATAMPADGASAANEAAQAIAVSAVTGEDDAEAVPPPSIEAAEDTPAEMSSDVATEAMNQASAADEEVPTAAAVPAPPSEAAGDAPAEMSSDLAAETVDQASAADEAASTAAALPAPPGGAAEDAPAEAPPDLAAEAHGTPPAEPGRADAKTAADDEPAAAQAATADADAPQDDLAMLETQESGAGTAAAGRPAGNWVVNLASYNHLSMARQKLAEFRDMGLAAEIQSATVDDRTIHRIRVGGFADSRAAIAGIAPLEKTTGLKGLWISRR